MPRITDYGSPFHPPKRASTLPVRFAHTRDVDRRHNDYTSRTRPRVRNPSLMRLSSEAVSSDTDDTERDVDSEQDKVRAMKRRRNHQDHSSESLDSADVFSNPSRSRSYRRSHKVSRPLSSSPSSSSRSRSRSRSRRARLSVPQSYSRLSARRRSQRSRSYHHHHHYASSSSGSESSVYDDDVYTFTIPGRASSLFGQESKTLASSTSISHTDDRPLASTTAKTTLKPETAYNVLRSQYHGQGYVGGEHRMDLTVTEEHRKTRSSLFRWVHFHDQSMNFDYFENSVRLIPGLDDAERSALQSLLAKVRTNFDLSYEPSGRVQMHIMDSGILHEPVSRPMSLKRPQHKPQIFTWLCMPFFSLEKYSNATSKLVKGAHPIRSLLQMQSLSVDWSRDSQQAVRTLAGIEPGLCYHVPQIWYLVLGDSLLVTCSHLSIASLRGKGITTALTPTPSSPKADSQRLLVYYGVSVLWSFQLDECQSWFALVTKFSEFWPTHFRLSFRGRTVTADLWPRIVHNAKHTHDSVSLLLQISGGNKPPLRGILRHHDDLSVAFQDSLDTAPGVMADDDARQININPMSPVGPSSESPKLTGHSTIMDEFFVFAWLSLREGKKVSIVNHDQIHRDLQAVDTFLNEQTNLDESLAYKRSPKSTWTVVHSALRHDADAISKSVTNPERPSERLQRAKHERRVDTFNAIESVFDFFLPLSYEGPTVGKFWGSLAILLQVMAGFNSSAAEPPLKSKRKRHELSYEEDDIREFGEEMESLLEIMRPFKELLAQTPLDERAKIVVPEEFPRAWLHLTMSLIFAANHMGEWRLHSRITAKLVDKGAKRIMLDLTDRDLLADSVVMPQEIATAINFQLLQDEAKSESSHDIVRVYVEYFNQLNHEVRANPNRIHQDRILRLKQEVTIIKTAFESQRKILSSLRNRDGEKHHHQQLPGLTGFSQLGNERTVSRNRTYSRPHDSAHVDYYEEPVTTGNVMLALSGDSRGQSKLTPTDPKGYRELYNQECLELVRRKLESLRELKDKATELEDWNIRSIETSKDRQDAAIYIFTIVTVVFLPLSTVAGILGMNTNDIRNMEINQWVFWAVALPVMFVVIFLCLAWSGELDNSWRKFRYWFRKDQGAQMTYTDILRDYERDLKRSRSRSGRRSYRGRHLDALYPSDSDSSRGAPIMIERQSFRGSRL